MLRYTKPLISLCLVLGTCLFQLSCRAATDTPSPAPTDTPTQQTLCPQLADLPLKIEGKSHLVISGKCLKPEDNLNWVSGSRLMLISNASDITIQDFALNVPSHLNSAIAIVNASDITIRNNQFSGGKQNKSLLHARSINGGSVSNITIENNRFSDSPGVAVLIDSWKYVPSREIKGIRIRHNTFSDLFQAIRFVQSKEISAANNRPTGIMITENTMTNIGHVAIIAIWGPGQANQIADNRLTNICSSTSQRCNAISCEFCEGGAITHNLIKTVRNCRGCGGDGAGIIIDWAHKSSKYPSSDIEVSDNTISDCTHPRGGGGIIVWKGSNISVFGNKLNDNRHGIIVRNRESSNNLIYNNDIHRSAIGIAIKKDARSTQVYNNNTTNNKTDILIKDQDVSNVVVNNYLKKCKGCKEGSNIEDDKIFLQVRCSGGLIKNSERKGTRDANGNPASGRPIGASACQDNSTP